MPQFRIPDKNNGAEDSSPRAEGIIKVNLPKLVRKPDLKRQVGAKPPAVGNVQAHSFQVSWMCWNCAQLNLIPSNWSSYTCCNSACNAFCTVEPASND